MSTATIAGPRPIVGWDADDRDWHAARLAGIGASDVTTALGFNQWQTPWQLWATKTGRRSGDTGMSTAAQLGHDLEPWLLQQAAARIGKPVRHTRHRLYAHPEHPWRLCSPDGESADGGLVEAKTAGLAGGYGVPYGWTDTRIPLAYELQCRWQLHVMNRPVVHVVALAAGLGVCMYRIERDMATEHELVTQVDAWWQRHIVQDVEPAAGAADNTALAELYPKPDGQTVDIGLDGFDACLRYRDAAGREKTAKTEKDQAAAAIKALLGTSEYGCMDGHLLCVWTGRDGAVDWRRVAEHISDTTGNPLPDLDLFRRNPTRSLTVKEPS